MLYNGGMKIKVKEGLVFDKHNCEFSWILVM